MSLERVTRVSEALYRVTDLMPDEEPLKWTLRTKAIQLVELLSNIHGVASIKARADASARVQELIDAMMRLLDIAAGASFISRVNFDVLQREYGLLRQLPAREELLLFPSPAVPSEHNTQPQESYRDTEVSPSTSFPSRSLESAHTATIAVVPKGSAVSRPRAMTIVRPPTVKDDGRRARILSYLGVHPWASRGDVAAIFGREISEKTLQRELSSLVESGAIVKTGEKRWCRYAIQGQK